MRRATNAIQLTFRKNTMANAEQAVPAGALKRVSTIWATASITQLDAVAFSKSSSQQSLSSIQTARSLVGTVTTDESRPTCSAYR